MHIRILLAGVIFSVNQFHNRLRGLDIDNKVLSICKPHKIINMGPKSRKCIKMLNDGRMPSCSFIEYNTYIT